MYKTGQPDRAERQGLRTGRTGQVYAIARVCLSIYVFVLLSTYLPVYLFVYTVSAYLYIH